MIFWGIHGRGEYLNKANLVWGGGRRIGLRFLLIFFEFSVQKSWARWASTPRVNKALSQVSPEDVINSGVFWIFYRCIVSYFFPHWKQLIILLLLLFVEV